MSDSDALLVKRILCGEREAFAGLVERYQPMVLVQALAVTGRLDRAEELAKEAFLRAYRALAGLRKPASFAVWLAGIARRLCAEWLERDAGETESLPPGEGPSPADRVIWTAITILPPDDAVILILKHRVGFSCREIGAALGLPTTTVLRSLSRAYETLSEQLAGHPLLEEQT